MQLKDVMTRNIEEIPAEISLTDAATRMKSLDIGALPVRDSGKLVGILTDRDIAVRAVAKGCDPMQTPARDAMSP